MSVPLTEKVALITGAGQGIGQGIAFSLAKRGVRVIAVGRTLEKCEHTCALITDRFGTESRALECDIGDFDRLDDLVAEAHGTFGRIDILVNNVYRIPSPPAWGGGFWDHPVSIWDDQVGIGLRAHYVASWHAAPLLFEAGAGGLIVNVSSPGGQSYHFSSSYGAGKAGLDRLTADMGIELKDKGIAAISLYPGSVATEFIVANSERTGGDLSHAQTPLGVGRTVAALALAEDLMARTGTIQWVEDLSQEFDVRDEQGRLAPAYQRRVD